MEEIEANLVKPISQYSANKDFDYIINKIKTSILI